MRMPPVSVHIKDNREMLYVPQRQATMLYVHLYFRRLQGSNRLYGLLTNLYAHHFTFTSVATSPSIRSCVCLSVVEPCLIISLAVYVPM